MKKIYTYLNVIAAVLILFSLCAYADDEFKIKDYSGIIADSAKAYINSKNDILFASAGAKIIFVTTDSTDGLSTGEYCEKLYSDMKMSRYGRCNSVLFVIAAQSNDYSYRQGANISAVLTDDTIDKLIVESFEPGFAKEHYTDAVLKFYNALALWYQNEYNGIDLGIDTETEKYTYGTKTKDIIEKPSKLWIWIGLAACIVGVIIIFLVKRSIEFKIRQHERRKLKKKFKIDIDKIVNS